MSVKVNADSAATVAMDSRLSNDEVRRYGRQLVLPEWGRRGKLEDK